MNSNKILLFAIVFLTIHCSAFSQDIVNIVYVGDKGITEDIKDAHSFVVVKQYPGGIFERLDYKMGAPLTMLRTYNDSNLSVLDGKYLTYDETGALLISGQYSNNQKHGSWQHYNDTGKIVLKEEYNHDSLLTQENPDTVKKKDPVIHPDEREAEFADGKRAWIRYLQDALGNMPAHLRQLTGKVRVMFVVGTNGNVSGVYLRKSALFGLDEEAIKIIRQSPPWKPAFQKGRNVNAYRIQPLTFMGE